MNREERGGDIVHALVSIVVVNWNGRKHLARCLPAALAQTYRPTEVIVVDNGSTDGSAEYVAEAFPSVRLLRSERNLGFAGGNNLGISAASGDYVAALNSDARPEPTWVAEMVRAMEGADEPSGQQRSPAPEGSGREARSARVGMVASKMLLADRPNVIDSTGVCLDRAGIAWDRQGGWPDGSEPGKEPLLGPCAGAALYRREMLDEIGLFDERFFLYLEDVDLAWRARLAGWGRAYAPEARVLHEHSASAGEDSPLKRYQLGRNKLWLIAKNYPSPQVWAYLPAIVLFDLLAVLAYVVAPPNPRAPLRSRLAAVQGRLAGLAGLGGALTSRREVQRLRRLDDKAASDPLAPLAAPWAVYRRYGYLGK